MNGYNHLTASERRRIERLLESGTPVREIARRLHRSPGTISEEVKRNGVRGEYIGRKARHKARVRRQQSKIQCMKAATDVKLKDFVTQNIRDEQSPESISGRIKEVETDIKYASPKAIYKFVHSVHGRQIERCLYSKAVKKKSGPKRKKSATIDGRQMIDQRPKEAEKREEFGHFEGDFIESGHDGHGSLLVLVERKSRYPFLAYTESKKTEEVNKLVAETLKDVPVKSVTIDNDLSFQKHEELSRMIKADVFFCHPYHSWEKGTVENRNKAIRRYIPKRTDLSGYSQDYFKMVEEKLRTRFMKCLNYRTSREVFERETEKFKNKKTPLCGIIGRTLQTNESVRLQGSG